MLLRLECRPALGDRGITVVRLVGPVQSGKIRLQAVIVGLRNRIEFVVVALRAADRQAVERLDGIADHIVAIQVPRNFAVVLCFGNLGVTNQIPRPCRNEPESLDTVSRVGIQHVAGNLLLDEPSPGLVLVKRPHDVIAIGPGVGSRLVLIVSVGVAVVDDVEPMPGPPLAVVRRIQQLVHQSLVRVAG